MTDKTCGKFGDQLLPDYAGTLCDECRPYRTTENPPNDTPSPMTTPTGDTPDIIERLNAALTPNSASISFLDHDTLREAAQTIRDLRAERDRLLREYDDLYAILDSDRSRREADVRERDGEHRANVNLNRLIDELRSRLQEAGRTGRATETER